MSSLLGKIVSGVLVAGSSVLSIIAPPVGVPLLGLSVGIASQTFSTDHVSNSGQVVAQGKVNAIANSVVASQQITSSLLNQNDLYNSYIRQGYTPAQAAQMSGINPAGSAFTTIPQGIKYALIAIAGFVLLKVLKIIK